MNGKTSRSRLEAGGGGVELLKLRTAMASATAAGLLQTGVALSEGTLVPVCVWLRSLSDEEKLILPVGTSEISFRLKRWSERDPVDALMVEKMPEPKGVV